jgi:hypothetical protein
MSEPQERKLQWPLSTQVFTLKRTTTLVTAHTKRQRHVISFLQRVDISIANMMPPTWVHMWRIVVRVRSWWDWHRLLES